MKNKKEKMNEEITNQIKESREKLRNIYKKYSQELYEVISKIDKFLEKLE